MVSWRWTTIDYYMNIAQNYLSKIIITTNCHNNLMINLDYLISIP